MARKYDYKYDNANRITRAEYSQNTSGSSWDASTLDFSVWGIDSDNGYGIKYDANGNILMMIQSGIPITKSGYLYIWVSNETPNWDVFFDNLRVAHYTGPLLEETHYYPFGLTMAGISSKALKPYYAENKDKFNHGSEFQSKEFADGTGLELYDAKHRMYDPQLGRFGQIDPLGDVTNNMSPYTFANNNPILLNDPFGLLSDSLHPQELATVTIYGHKKRAWGGFYWPESTSSERKTWARNQDLFASRKFSRQPLAQKGDPSSYLASVPMYKRWAIEEENSRAMQAWAVGIIASPALTGTTAAELAVALRIKLGFNLTAVAVDAAVQTTINSMQHNNIVTNYNIVSGATALALGVPEGAAFSNIAGVALINSSLSTSVNISTSSLQGNAPVLSFNPVSILINTAFGTAAGQYSHFVGGATGSLQFGDAAASPINLAGGVTDEAVKEQK